MATTPWVEQIGFLQVFTGVFGMLGPQKTIGATKAMAILVVAEYCPFV